MVFCFMELPAKSDLSALLGLLQNASRVRWKCQGAFVFSLIAALRRMRKQPRLFFHLRRESACVLRGRRKKRERESARNIIPLSHISYSKWRGALFWCAPLLQKAILFPYFSHNASLARSLFLSFYFAYDTIAVMHFNVLYHSLLNTI
jgi:hypothetical protein